MALLSTYGSSLILGAELPLDALLVHPVECAAPGEGPTVRIRFAPAGSQVRTHAGIQALIVILDNPRDFRQVGAVVSTRFGDFRD